MIDPPVSVGTAQQADPGVLRLQLLRLEHLAGSAVAALTGAGIDTLLLKGPVTSAWLYGGPEGRSYRDVDVLVRPARARAAAETLRAAGFEDLHARMLAVHRPPHERTWQRDGLLLDVHTRLAGVPAHAAARAFDILWAAREPFAVQGRPVPTLAPPARAVHLALHAAASRADSRAARDLEAGLAQLPPDLWREAHALAGRLDCLAPFVLGLSSTDAGRARCAQLGATTPPTVEALLKATGASIEAQNLLAALSVRPARGVPAALAHLVLPLPTEPVPARTCLSAAGRSVRAVGEMLLAARQARSSRKPRTAGAEHLISGSEDTPPGCHDALEEP